MDSDLLLLDANERNAASASGLDPLDGPSRLFLPLESPPDEACCLVRVDALACEWRRQAESSGGKLAEDEEEIPRVPLRELAEAGLLAAPLKTRHGGCGLGSEPGKTLALLRLLRHVGRGNLAVGRIYEGHVNALHLVETFGAPEQIARYAADARDRQRLFGVWNADAPAEGVRLAPAGRGRWKLEGAKIFASGAGRVERPIVNCALPDGQLQMCIVPMERVRARLDPSWWQPLGMKATGSFRVDFSGIELGPEHLLGAPGDYYREPWFNGGSMRFVAVQLGGAEALYNACRRYLARVGRQGDVFQQMRAAEMAVAVESGNLWLRGAAEMWERSAGGQTEALLAYVAMMRTAVESICMNVIALAERSVGARGLMRPEPFERMVRDLSMYLRQPAPDAAAARVGRYVLEQHPETPACAQWSGGDAGSGNR